MTPDIFRQWLRDRGCSFEEHERRRGEGVAAVTVRRGPHRSELPLASSRMDLQEEDVRRVVEELDLPTTSCRDRAAASNASAPDVPTDARRIRSQPRWPARAGGVRHRLKPYPGPVYSQSSSIATRGTSAGGIAYRRRSRFRAQARRWPSRAVTVPCHFRQTKSGISRWKSG